MQFKRTEHIGSYRVYFDFQTSLSNKVWKILDEIFTRMGGEQNSMDSARYFFPTFVTSEVVSEIIRNTCFVCGGLMRDGQALKNQDLIEIPNGLSMTSHVFSGAGEARLLTVRKCSVCGHSHT